MHASTLLTWYDQHRRSFPWKAAPGKRANPYHVLISELMLQQTTTATVRNYFPRFIERWPRVDDLAAASLDDVLHAWQGLGYYSRARNLHKAAQAIVANHNSTIPDAYETLLTLPGIGDYTASAVSSIAYGKQVPVVDANVERVISRLYAIKDPLPRSRPTIKEHAATCTPKDRPGDYAQAMMDLGATLCTARSAQCLLCPITDYCEGRKQGIAEILPIKAPKKERPVRHGWAFWGENEGGAVLLRKRPEKGLLGGMMEIPSTDWGKNTSLEEALPQAPYPSAWCDTGKSIDHVFTHFRLILKIASTTLPNINDGTWCAKDTFGDYALPTAMKKIVRAMT